MLCRNICPIMIDLSRLINCRMASLISTASTRPLSIFIRRSYPKWRKWPGISHMQLEIQGLSGLGKVLILRYMAWISWWTSMESLGYVRSTQTLPLRSVAASSAASSLNSSKTPSAWSLTSSSHPRKPHNPHKAFSQQTATPFSTHPNIDFNISNILTHNYLISNRLGIDSLSNLRMHSCVRRWIWAARPMKVSMSFVEFRSKFMSILWMILSPIILSIICF